ncbi:MAG: hypothetical protein JWL63_2058 [Rhodocyclales bacterium]|nr:hypothetical protein [Rhodocyclales bacterium]
MADTEKTTQTKTSPEQDHGSSRPPVAGDRGQDDAFATESQPEGLRYGEKPHKPGELPHPARQDHDTRHEPPISVGDE